MLELMQIVVAIIAACIPFLIGQRHGLLKFASPLHFVAYFTFFGFTVKAVVYALAPELAFYSNFRIGETSVGWGYVYFASFLMMISVGYLIAVRPDERVNPHTILSLVDRIRAPSFLLAIAVVVSLATTIVYLSVRDIAVLDAESSLEVVQGLNSRKIERIQGQTGIGNSYALIKLFYVLPSAVFVLLIIRAAISRTQQDIYYAIAISVVLVFSALMQGKRGDLLDLILFGLIAWAISDRRLDYKSISMALITFPLILVIFSFMSNIRSARGNINDTELLSLESLQPIFTSTYFADINIPILISAVSRPDQILYGQTYFYWAYAWIPRFLWEDKPVVTLGSYVKQDILGVYGGVGGYNATGAGEAFLNFGWYGVLVGLLIGYLFRRLEVSTLTKGGMLSRMGPVLYAIPFLGLLQGSLQSSFSAALTAAIAQVAVIWVFWRVLVKKPSKLKKVRGPRGHARERT